jgi:uncharacterized protein (DUF1697 family)
VAKFVALLRGINVGGNSIMRMSDLKACFEELEFEGVQTLLQSGNVIFETTSRSGSSLEPKIEKALDDKFGFGTTVMVRSGPEIKKVIAQMPADWSKPEGLRCYLAFTKRPLTPAKAIREIAVREGVDQIAVGPGVIYMTTQMKDLTKSAFNKLASQPLYKLLTIRNLNTTNKIARLLERH